MLKKNDISERYFILKFKLFDHKNSQRRKLRISSSRGFSKKGTSLEDSTKYPWNLKETCVQKKIISNLENLLRSKSHLETHLIRCIGKVNICQILINQLFFLKGLVEPISLRKCRIKWIFYIFQLRDRIFLIVFIRRWCVNRFL